MFLTTRLYSRTYRYAEATELLLNFIGDHEKPSSKEWRIAVSDLLKVCDKWANSIAHVEQDYREALRVFKIGLGVFAIASNAENVDVGVAEKFCNLVLCYLLAIPKIYSNSISELVSDVITKHWTQLSFAKNFERMAVKFNDIFDTNFTIPDDIESENRYRGYISGHRSDRPFVFIASDSGRYYAHRNDFMNIDLWDEIKNDSIVHFDLGENKEGVCAKNIFIQYVEDDIDY